MHIIWTVLAFATTSAVMACPTAARAVPDFLKAGNLKVMRCAAPDTRFEFVRSNEPGNVFFPGDRVDISIHVDTTKAPPNFVRLSIAAIAMRKNRFFPGQAAMDFANQGVPEVQYLGRRGHCDVPIPTPQGPAKNGLTIIARKIPVPQRYGSYVVTLAPAGKRPQFLCTLIRARKPKPGFDTSAPILGEVAMMADGADNKPKVLDRGARVYARLGIRIVRFECGWGNVESQRGVYNWQQIDPIMHALARARVKALMTIDGAPGWAMPFGQPTPATIPQKPDDSGMPRYMPLFGKFIRALCARYWHHGHGALWTLENWNEPWEGISISGWESDIAHYRAIMAQIADNAHAVSPRIHTAAACWIGNTENKFLTGRHPAKQIRPVDIFTDHYVPPDCSYGPMVARFWHKRNMDTETWVAHNEMLVPQVMTQIMACGQQHVNPCFPVFLYFSTPGATSAYTMPTPVALAASTFNYFCTDRPFQRLLFLHHLPFAFQFGKDPDAVVVLLGRLNSSIGGGLRGVLWWQFNLSRGGTMTVNNADGAIHFYNIDGDRVFAGRKRVTLPVNDLAYYLTCPKGGVARIRRRLGSAKYSGVRPVEIIAHDFTQTPGGRGISLHTTLHNLLPTAITGTLTITASSEIVLTHKTFSVSLRPGQSLDVPTMARFTRTSPANAYPFTYKFTSKSGNADWSETLHVLTACRKTIKMTGNPRSDLRAWRGIPGVMATTGAQESFFHKHGWLPYAQESQRYPKRFFAQVKLAWDAKYFYLLARVNDAVPSPGHLRLATRDDNQYFRGAKDDAICESLRPYKSIVMAGDFTKRSAAPPAVRKNPLWPAYLKFLAAHRQARAEVYTDAATVFFRSRRTNPKASFANATYVYKKNPRPGLPWMGNNFQFAFHVIPGYADQGMILDTKRVPAGFHSMPDTDYEYSLYQCTDGGSELWRLLAPGVPRGFYYPRQPRAKFDQGPVPAALHIVKRIGNQTLYEAAIPWTELSRWRPKVGGTFRFTFRINTYGGPDAGFDTLAPSILFGDDKSATKLNGLTLHRYNEATPSCSVRWGLAPGH